MTFRDVRAIDNRPVDDQQARLTRLFLEPFAVPMEMRESTITRLDGQVRGIATYGRFRRFDVRTSEEIGTP